MKTIREICEELGIQFGEADHLAYQAGWTLSFTDRPSKPEPSTSEPQPQPQEKAPEQPQP